MENRLAEIYTIANGEIYEAFESFDEAKLTALCLTLGTTRGDAQWVGNLMGLYDYLAAEQKKEI